MSSRSAPLRPARVLAVAVSLVVLAGLLAISSPASPAAAAPPAGFRDEIAFSGLVSPMAVRFAPDGRVFVAEKRGTIQMYDRLGDTTPTQIADLRTEVHNFWDRGLHGLAVDPAFPTRPYLYALYTFDGPVGGRAPRWGTPGADSDPCPDPPGATRYGCVVSGKLVRLTLTGTSTTKQDLLHDWCQQFPSHSQGDLVFGRDGALYVSSGDGASFGFVDHGQRGDPPNVCGDPTGAGGAMVPPGAQGGALRSQDLRTLTDPVGLDGTVLRVSPDTGAALPDNPNAGAARPNARRIIAYGLRNPFRMAVRPGTDEVWLGDVGWNTTEEIDRLPAPTREVRNFGWPCYESAGRQPGYDAADLSLCEGLYGQAGAHATPFFGYRHGAAVAAGDGCENSGGSSVSGIAFQPPVGGAYPPAYAGALYFADYSRRCIYVVPRAPGGWLDRSAVRPFVTGAAGPVDLEVSPQGELFYVDLVGGRVRRIAYTGPTVCPDGQYFAEYFTGRELTGTPARTGCEVAPLAHEWGRGGPGGVGIDDFSARWTGTFDLPVSGEYTFTAVADDGIRVLVDGTPLIDQWRDQTRATHVARRALSAGAHEVQVEYYEAAADAVARLDWSIDPNASAPAATIAAPAEGTRWAVGDPITFSGSATDPEEGLLPAERLDWRMVLRHCPQGCHSHELRTWTGIAGATIDAPDHEYPSHLELSLTATDATGRSSTVTRRLDPRTVGITLASRPPGLRLALGSRTATAPVTGPAVVGSTLSLAAPTPQDVGGAVYRFTGWSDGGAGTHLVTVGTAPVTFTASYQATSCPAGSYRAEYFPNRTLTGPATAVVCEAAPLSRDWGTGAPPGMGVRANDFSVRWTGTFRFPGGNRTFTATSDDGMRVWLDGTRIVDRWSGKGTTRVTRSVPAGDHVVRVAYWEGTGTASARVTW